VPFPSWGRCFSVIVFERLCAASVSVNSQFGLRPTISVLGFHMKLKNGFFPFVFRRGGGSPPPAGSLNLHFRAQFILFVSEALFIVPKNEHFRRSKIRTYLTVGIFVKCGVIE
jgi:hypothetical protein